MPKKNQRSMKDIHATQQKIEQATQKKFESVKSLIDEEKSSTGRINPQLCCTIAPSDRVMLNDLTVYACNREHRIVTTSSMVRALIRLGNKHKEELEFD